MTVQRGLAFLTKLAAVISQLGYSNIKLARSLAERQRAEQRLAYLASFPEQNPNPIMEVGLDGAVRYANPSARRLLPDIDARPLAHPWLADFEAMTRPVREGRAATAVRDVTVGDRSYSQAWSYFPAERFVRIYGLDNTERVRAEEVLRTTMERFYSALAGMYGGILLVTNDGKVEFANRAICEQFHLDAAPEDLIGWNADRVLGAIRDRYVDSEKAVARILEIVGRGEPVRGKEVVMADGRTCLRDFVPITLEGKSYGRLWHHLDITERKRADEALRESERRERERAEELAVLFEAVPIPVFIARDPDCLHLAGNRLADEILRIPRGNELSLSAPPKPGRFTSGRSRTDAN